MIWRWESATRWYEAELISDLFGDWLVVRRWGGLYSERYGTKTDVVPDLFSGPKSVLRSLRGINALRQRSRRSPQGKIREPLCGESVLSRKRNITHCWPEARSRIG